MSDPDLFGALAPPASPVRYFAIRPDRAAALTIDALIADARRRHGLRGRGYPADRLHVSLCRVGRLEGDVEGALEAAGHVDAPAFPVLFDTISTFGGGRNTCLVLRCSHPIDPLDRLWQRLMSELGRVPVAPARPNLVAHVTLIRPAPRLPDVRLAAPIGWVVRDFVLAVKGRGRSSDLGRWPLR